MKHYDLTGAKVIESIDTPWIYCNDNMTPEEKQQAYDDAYEWFYDVIEALEIKRRSVFSNVVYLGDYL